MTRRHLTTFAVLTLFATGMFAATASAQYGAYTESFDSGFTGANLDDHLDWINGGGNPVVPTDGIGVNGSVGLSDGQYIFIWEAHPFDFNDPEFTSATLQADWQTDASGHLDDDRLGLFAGTDNTNSDLILGVQADPGGSGASGYNIETYWDSGTGGNIRNSIVELPALSANAWYQMELTITKLTSSSVSMDVEFWQLDATGARVGATPLAVGSVADTSSFGADQPGSTYFTAATLYPAFKNYNTIEGAFDNAQATIVPEPATLGLLSLGGFALFGKRRR